MAARRRLDAEMVRRNLVGSRQLARDEIEQGRVLVDGAPALKPARLVDPAQDVRLLGPPPRYVSRAGLKLEVALDQFGIDPAGWRCLDVGASTGGFTDCLLARGAAQVFAVDVGTHQLHERLRADERVHVHEQTDIRTVTPELVGGTVDLIVADLSFISLRLVLESLASLAVGSPILALVKPQFEAGRAEASRGRGVIRDPEIWRRVLGEVVRAAAELGLAFRSIAVSPITGSAGNVEFIVWLESGRSNLGEIGADADPAWIEEMLTNVVAKAEARNQ
ncbi:MAG: TlyA family RNA methyltransferase [Actinomycetia bacterium]|nr:TlyA family RNA methyltransferase [Actinomycetes bacterium]MCP5034108.1 TlyA family RNA methyltransferase [Actinomycetes bacterium]